MFQYIRTERPVDLLLGQEIRNHGVHVHARGEGHGTDGAMGEDMDVIRLRHVGDLLEFRDAAGVGSVGLDVGRGLFFEDLAELPSA